MIASRKAASWTSFGTNGAGRKVSVTPRPECAAWIGDPYDGGRSHLPRGAVFTVFTRSKGRAKRRADRFIAGRPVDKMGSRAK